MLKKTAAEIVTRSPFAGTEVVVSRSRRQLTRYGNNEVTQNLDQQSVSVLIRGSDGKKSAQIEVGSLEPKFIQSAMEKLAENLKNLPPSPNDENFSTPAETFSRPRIGGEVFNSELGAQAIEKAISSARANGLQASGTWNSQNSEVAFVSSGGFSGDDSIVSAEFTCTMDVDGAAGESGHGYSAGVLPSDLDFHGVISTALEKCLASRNAKPIPPGPYDVILESKGVAELASYFCYATVSGKAYVEKTGPLSGKIGQKILSEYLSLTDDPEDPKIQGHTFDFQGTPKKRVDLFRDGVFVTPTLDKKTARALGRQSTGHGYLEPNAFSPLPRNPVVQWKGKTESLSSMIASTKKGILVTQLHYINIVDPTIPSLTGMTRDGTFLIEDGQIVGALKNMRFVDSAIRMFNSIISATPDSARVNSVYGDDAGLFPTMKIKDFNFSSGTEF